MIQTLIPISTSLIPRSARSLKNAKPVGRSIREKNNNLYQLHTSFSQQADQSIDADYEDLWDHESSKPLKIYKQIS